MRDIRAAARVIGRRTTLRYLAVGVGASLLAACEKGGSGGSGGGGGGTTGPAGKAFAAFVRGTWNVESTSVNGDKGTCTVTVDDGVWTIDWPGEEAWHGTWALQGGRLALQVPESPSSPEDLTDAAATDVPSTVGDSVGLALPWQPPGATGTGDGQKLEVDYNGKAGLLRIRHVEAGGSMTIHTCTRA